MKSRTVKLLAAAIIAGNMMMGGTVSTLAEEATEAVTMEEVNSSETITTEIEIAEDSQKAATVEKTDGQEAASPDESYLYGVWRLENGVRILLMPDGRMYEWNMADCIFYGTCEIEKNQVVLDQDMMSPELRKTSPEINSVSMELQTIAEGDLEAGDTITEDKYNIEVGKDKMLVIKVQYTDASDPLSPDEVEEVLYAYKGKNMMDYLMMLFENTTWEMNGNVLTVGECEGLSSLPVSLNDGEQTGSMELLGDARLAFAWDGGSTIEYNYATADAKSVTFTDAENPGKTIIFTRVDMESSEETEM